MVNKFIVSKVVWKVPNDCMEDEIVFYEIFWIELIWISNLIFSEYSEKFWVHRLKLVTNVNIFFIGILIYQMIFKSSINTRNHIGTIYDKDGLLWRCNFVDSFIYLRDNIDTGNPVVYFYEIFGNGTAYRSSWETYPSWTSRTSRGALKRYRKWEIKLSK